MSWLRFFKSRFEAITARAHHAATSPQNDRPEPTDAQKKAGNFKKGHVTIQGLGISIENPAGSLRSGVTREGKIWRTTMRHHYGYIKRTEGADDDQVDCFVGEHPESELIFVIDQVDPGSGAFDEHKVIVGARSEAEARAIYAANYQAGWKGLGAITALPIAEFKEWLENHDTKSPLAPIKAPPRHAFFKSGNVQNPGSRGGVFYIDHAGKVRYGTPPQGEREFTGAQSRSVRSVVTPRSGMRYAGQLIRNPEDAARIFRASTSLVVERCHALHLDDQNVPRIAEFISQGNMNSTPADARDCLRNALHLGTRRVIMIHNHPSTSPQPSPGDLKAAEAVDTVASRLGIDVPYHIVVARGGYGVISPGGITSTHPWTTSATARGKQLPGAQAHLEHPDHGSLWTLFGQSLHDADQAAAAARVLFDPQDKIGVFMALDSPGKIIGIFPFAHDHIDPDAVNRATDLAVRSGAVHGLFAFSADGPSWMDEVGRSKPIFDAVGETGTPVIAYMVVGDSQHFVLGGHQQP